MKVKLLADADLNMAILNAVLRHEPALDFLSAKAAGKHGLSDPAVLAIATHQQRILVSHDVGTMPVHLQIFRKSGNHSPGVLLNSWPSALQSRNSYSFGSHPMLMNGSISSFGCHSNLR